MSKKSRRRNKKILGALAAIGGAAMLANRRRNASIAANEAKEAGFDIPTTIMDNMPKGIDKKIVDVPVVTTPNTIKDSQVLGRMRGNVNAGGGFQGQSKRSAYAQRMRNLDADINRNNMLRSIRSNVDIATTPDSILQGVPEEALMAKKGGRIVKGEKVAKLKKKKSIQIRGFGKARRG